jgi:hypothetical protein
MFVQLQLIQNQRNCEEMERLTKKVLAIKVVGYHQTNSGIPSAVTLDDL